MSKGSELYGRVFRHSVLDILWDFVICHWGLRIPGSWKAPFRFCARIGTMNLSGARHRYGVPPSGGPSRSSRLKAELHTNHGSWKAPSAPGRAVGPSTH